MLVREQLEELKQQLLDRSWKEPLVAGAPSSALNAYLSMYGFDQLMDLPEYKYCAGYLATEIGNMLIHRWERVNASATILVVHGLFDHMGLYLKLVRSLLDAGFDVIGLDMPGHGLSEGDGVSIHSYDDYGVVFKSLLTAVKAKINRPLYCVAQSNGSAAMMSYLLQGFEGEPVPKVERIIMLAPLVRAKGWWKIQLAYCLLSKFLNSVAREFNNNSHDQAFQYFLKNQDPLQSRIISVEWVGSLRRWVKNFDQFDKTNIPTLVIQGEGDSTVDSEWNWRRIQTKFTCCNRIVIPGALHHLVNESDEYREKIFDHISGFLLKEI